MRLAEVGTDSYHFLLPDGGAVESMHAKSRNVVAGPLVALGVVVGVGEFGEEVESDLVGLGEGDLVQVGGEDSVGEDGAGGAEAEADDPDAESRRGGTERGGGGGGGGTLQFILVLHRAGLYRIWRSGGRFFSGGGGSGEGGFGCGGGGVSVEDGGEGDAENPEDSGEEGG